MIHDEAGPRCPVEIRPHPLHEDAKARLGQELEMHGGPCHPRQNAAEVDPDEDDLDIALAETLSQPPGPRSPRRRSPRAARRQTWLRGTRRNVVAFTLSSNAGSSGKSRAVSMTNRHGLIRPRRPAATHGNARHSQICDHDWRATRLMHASGLAPGPRSPLVVFTSAREKFAKARPHRPEPSPQRRTPRRRIRRGTRRRRHGSSPHRRAA